MDNKREYTTAQKIYDEYLDSHNSQRVTFHEWLDEKLEGKCDCFMCVVASKDPYWKTCKELAEYRRTND